MGAKWNGTPKVRGENSFGNLGTGDSMDTTAPRPMTTKTFVVGFSMGYHNSFAIDEDGALRSVGYGETLRLGTGSTAQTAQWQDVSGLSWGVTAVSGGYTYHACAIQNGSAKCWGRQDDAALGNGQTSGVSLVPTQVQGLTSGVTSICAAYSSSCAVHNGAVKCWGSSSIGALGTSTKLETTPTQVIGLTSGWEEVVCAYHHACARSSAGAVKCWGYTSAYPLAIDWTPKDVVGLSSDVKALTAGNDHFCALMASGPPRCWGGNQTGQLGDGTTTMAGGWVAPPVIVKDLTNVIRIAGGQLQTCAMRNDGRVFCWGYIKPGVNGQFITYSAVPVQMPGFP